jgi:hypothetical protein
MNCWKPNPIEYKHHILPKHQGGSDDETNLIKVSSIRHAMFHYANWQLYGKLEDWCAYRGYCGLSNSEEILQLKMRIGGLRQPKEVRSSNGTKVAKWFVENKNTLQRNRLDSTYSLLESEVFFHVYEQITQRTFGKSLGTVSKLPGEDFADASRKIKESFGLDVDSCKLAPVASGKRLQTKGVFCSVGMAISSQAPHA